MVSRIFTKYFYFTRVISICFSYKWDLDHIVKTLLCMSESEEKQCQEMLTDLLGSLFILLSGEPNHIFDQHIQIIQQFLAQVLILSIIYINTRQYLDNLLFFFWVGVKSLLLYYINIIILTIVIA